MCKTDHMGAIIHARSPGQYLPGLLRALLIESAGEAANVQMRYIQTMPPGSNKFSRQHKITQPTLAQLLAACVSGAVDCILMGSGSLSAYSDEPIVLLKLSTTSDDMLSLSMDGPFELLDYKKTVHYLRWIVSQFQCDYGQVVAGDRNYVMSLLSYIPILNVEGIYEATRTGHIDSQMSQFESEMHFYYGRQGDLCRFIPRATWGNILSTEHISGLGGEERIRNECDCFLVERWGSNLYLQLTESPSSCSKADLVKLNRYFEPIRFPNAPEPIYL